MPEPYSPPLITRLLRGFSDAELREVTPNRFQTWPAKRIVKGPIIQELISNERARRRGNV